MRASEIREYFISRSDRVNPETTVDTFKCGDPEVEVQSVGVTWMLTMGAIDEARRLGVNFVITHEPIFYTHRDETAEVADDPAYLAKAERLEEASLTVLRLHDCWDWWPEIGVCASLATLLELALVDEGPHHTKVFAVHHPAALDDFAAFVRDRLSMDAVQVMGDGAKRVERVGLCFGMSGGLPRLRAYCAQSIDCIVAGELINWQDVRYLQDNRMPLVLTDHAASENPGMRSLAEFVRGAFGVEAHFIETGPALRTTGCNHG
jgi:putative NIF3 family GTP cyclohydrolase 1 type 2